MTARHIAHQSPLAGHTVLFTCAGHLLNELAGADGDHALGHCLPVYTRPRLLVVDVVSYRSYSNLYADQLFEIVLRRYEAKSTLITTAGSKLKCNTHIYPVRRGLAHGTWIQTVDGRGLSHRLVHHAEILTILVESYRLMEAKKRVEQGQHTRTLINRVSPRTNKYNGKYPARPR